MIDAEDAPTINRRSVRETPIEVIIRGERRRIWTPEQKRGVVVESLEPGVFPIAVARRHGIGGGGLLCTWRRQMAWSGSGSGAMPGRCEPQMRSSSCTSQAS
ncbi:transposase [Teichococcus aestuarii]